jgi:hypothetical protein
MQFLRAVRNGYYDLSYTCVEIRWMMERGFSRYIRIFGMQYIVSTAKAKMVLLENLENPDQSP